MYIVSLGVLAKFQFEQLITSQCSGLPAVSAWEGACFVFLSKEGLEGLAGKQLSPPPQRRAVSEVVRKLPASLRGAACKVIWDKRHPCECEEFYYGGNSKLSITPLLNHCSAQNKMGSDCVFLKSLLECDGILWSPSKGMFLFCFCFSEIPSVCLTSSKTSHHCLASCSIPEWPPSQLTKDKERTDAECSNGKSQRNERCFLFNFK